ncbi:HD domain-containing protein [Rugosimonospora acidiphila]|uniref:HD domain-containing protein n=1 Tax=Rugosimonospora acidiphila TaxID=556531 RepID=A0ABP9SE85_9ACTN
MTGVPAAEEPGQRTVIPTDGQIRALHERYAPTLDAFELVYTHCEIVCAVAEQLLAGLGSAVDVGLVRAGCLLHDIGVYRLYDQEGQLDQKNYLRHGVLGDALLRELGLPESLRRFCSHHTGVGISREDVLRQGLPLPAGDYLAETDEERLVMYADKFHSKTIPPVFVSAASYAAGVRRFGEDKVARFAAMVDEFGEPDLSGLSRRYRHPVV